METAMVISNLPNRSGVTHFFTLIVHMRVYMFVLK